MSATDVTTECPNIDPQERQWLERKAVAARSRAQMPAAGRARRGPVRIRELEGASEGGRRAARRMARAPLAQPSGKRAVEGLDLLARNPHEAVAHRRRTLEDTRVGHDGFVAQRPLIVR